MEEDGGIFESMSVHVEAAGHGIARKTSLLKILSNNYG